MKRFSGKCGQLVGILVVLSLVLGACGENTATPIPTPTSTPPLVTTTASPTTVPVVTGVKTATTTEKLAASPTPGVTKNQEFLQALKPFTGQLEELPVDPALEEGIRKFYDNQPDLLVKLYRSKAAFDYLDQTAQLSAKLGYDTSSISGNFSSLFSLVLVKQHDYEQLYPQLAEKLFVGGNGRADFYKTELAEMSRLSNERFNAENFKTLINESTVVWLAVIGSRLTGIIPAATLSTPLPTAVTPADNQIPIQGSNSLAGELGIYQKIYDSSRSYTSIHYMMVAGSPTGKNYYTLTYTAVKTGLKGNSGLELEMVWQSVALTDRVIIAAGQRYENRQGAGWLKGAYIGLPEEDYALRGQVFAEQFLPLNFWAGYYFSPLPDENFKGQLVGHFKLEKAGSGDQTWLEVRYDKQTYKPVQLVSSQGGLVPTLVTTDYEYNNSNWKIDRPVG